MQLPRYVYIKFGKLVYYGQVMLLKAECCTVRLPNHVNIRETWSGKIVKGGLGG